MASPMAQVNRAQGGCGRRVAPGPPVSASVARELPGAFRGNHLYATWSILGRPLLGPSYVATAARDMWTAQIIPSRTKAVDPRYASPVSHLKHEDKETNQILLSFYRIYHRLKWMLRTLH
ncbi:hypothetical protein GUJ93_ZPchr0010g7906 [Zizania palustris]|uniref:Uncharacterized protein n=1 Tax=Zizania palustris TaxID=103762 RepID=A0A8J5WCI4_ZIZPA|nr:hypothetical protein GUJ93_ZPchr0010g7906 [Zizania palustris]